jgi:hypothetical protein
MVYHHRRSASDAEGIPLIQQHDDENNINDEHELDAELRHESVAARHRRHHGRLSTLKDPTLATRWQPTLTLVVVLTALVLTSTFVSAALTAFNQLYGRSPRTSLDAVKGAGELRPGADGTNALWSATQVPRMADVQRLRRPGLYLGLERVVEIQQVGLAFGPTYSPEEDMEMGMGMHGGNGEKETFEQKAARVSSIYPNKRFAQDGWLLVSETVCILCLFQFCLFFDASGYEAHNSNLCRRTTPSSTLLFLYRVLQPLTSASSLAAFLLDLRSRKATRCSQSSSMLPPTHLPPYPRPPP